MIGGVGVLTPQPAMALIDDASPSIGWRPTNGTVYAMARVGDMVVLGGSFTQMVSATGVTATRNRLAAVSASTGELLPWSPAVNGTVRALASSPDGSRLYIGGLFTSVASTTRTNLAAISTQTGSVVSAFNAAPNAEVRALLFHDGGLFVGGVFWRVGSTSRGGGAELDPESGALRPWNPRTNWGIYALAPSTDGTEIFIGGPFNTASGAARDFLAKVARSDGTLLPWVSGSTCQDALNPCQVLALAVEGTRLYVGSGGPGGRVVALDATSGVQRWWTGGDGDVQALALVGNSVVAGGHWEQSFNGVSRAGIVALDKSTGSVLSKPSAMVIGGTAVWSLLADGSRLHLGGQFTSVDGRSLGRYTTFAVTPDPLDVTPPGQPGTPSSPATFAESVSLRWAASTDNVSTVEYRITRNGQQVGVSPIPFFRDTTAAPETAYDYSVIALDAAGNASLPSATRRVTTPPAGAQLLSRTASWHYYSTGNDPGADWTTSSFSDADWPASVGEFGFGDGDETTYIAPLGVVHYFRTKFSVEDASKVDSATLRVLADDGAVAYVNGTELGRFNVSSGAVTNSTRATTSLGVPAEMTYQSLGIPVSALRDGANQIAVSVHNNSSASSDVSFDAFIDASVRSAPEAPDVPKGLSATATATTASLTWAAVSGATAYDIVRDGATVGTSTVASFKDSDLTPSTTYEYSVIARNDVGSSAPSPVVSVTTADPPTPPGVPNVSITGTTATTVTLSWPIVAGADDYVVIRDGVELPPVTSATFTDTGRQPATSYEYSVVARNVAGTSQPSTTVTGTTSAALVTSYAAIGDVWRANDTGEDLGAAWLGVDYVDSSWKKGPSELGYGDGDEATALTWGSDPNRKPITVYFRRNFDAGASVSDVTGLSLRALIDDGAVVYLNGSEVWRFNLPVGSISSTTRASRFIGGAEERQWRTATLPASALVPGLNTIAVEVHNDAPSSSDLSFNLELAPVR